MISQPGRANPPHIPDPELAALRSDIIKTINTYGYNELPTAEATADKIMATIATHHNALLDKVLGLLVDEIPDPPLNSTDLWRVGMFDGRRQFKKELRAEVEKLKEK